MTVPETNVRRIEVAGFSREEAKQILESLKPFERERTGSKFAYTIEFVRVPFMNPAVYQAVMGVTGNTFPIKDSLKKNGWYWNSTERQWQFVSKKPLSFVEKIPITSAFQIIRDPLAGV
jgi:hypothetical protein